MTYQEALENNPNLITADIDDVLKQTIYNWFYDWNICYDNKFQTYFNRVLTRDYPRYRQLLRIQPGEAEYDWLVGNYSEREVINEGTTSKSNSSTNKTTSTGSNTETNSKTGTDTTQGSNNITKTPNLTDKVTIEGSETNVRSGSETDATTHGLGATNQTQSSKNNQSHTSQTSASDNTSGKTYSGSESANKAGPMDATVVSTGIDDGGVPNVNVSYGGHASQIASNYNAETTSGTDTSSNTTTDTYSGDADTVETKTEAVTNTDSGNKTYNNVTDKKDFTDRADTTMHTGTEETVESSSGSTTYGSKDETTGSNSNETNGEISGTETGNSNNTMHERYTGRQAPPADIMERAVAFIETTNAWEWLEERLRPLFIMVFDI